MKILLISGHGAGDCGAIGNGFKEADLTREVVNILADKLKNYMAVDIYNQARNAYEDVNKRKLQVNFANYNYVFEVHFNAYNGTAKGTEIFVTREEPATEVEEKIMNQLSKYFVVRGVKRKNFNVIAKARRSGVSSALIEVCFIDNAEDMNIYQNNKDGVVNAIADGILEGFSIEKKREPDLLCNAHIQDIGWTGYKDTSKEMVGTEGQGKRLEAIQFKANNGLEIQYRVHVQNIGWQDWKNNGEIAGTEGQSLGIEAIEIKCNKILEVQEHIQYVGWMPKSKGTEIYLGTEGKSLRLEAFRINIV